MGCFFGKYLYKNILYETFKCIPKPWQTGINAPQTKFTPFWHFCNSACQEIVSKFVFSSLAKCVTKRICCSQHVFTNFLSGVRLKRCNHPCGPQQNRMLLTLNTILELTISIEYSPLLWRYMSHLLLLGKFEYTGGPIFKVVLEC